MAATSVDHFMIHIRVVEAKGLFPPYDTPVATYCKVKMSDQDKKFKTRIAEPHSSPTWNQDFTFHRKNYQGFVVIKVMGCATFKDSILGRARIELDRVKGKGTYQGWIDLSDVSDSHRVNGSVFVKLVVDADHSAIQKKEPERFDLHRKSWIHTKTYHYDAKEMPVDSITLFVGTWNVGNRPPPDDLSPWLPREGFEIIAIGAQECEYQARKPHPNCEADWEARLKLHFGDNYLLIGKKSLWQMRLLVFASRKATNLITHVDVSTEATGVASVMGNKGGVVCSMMIKDTSICFVNSHLAAHQHKKTKRNEDVAEIVEGCNVGWPHQDILHQFDHVVWMGDLNYRLDYGDQGDDKTPSDELFKEMVQVIEKKEYSKLYACDQLVGEMKAQNVFRGFREGIYNFPPTFKVERKADLVYNAERSPAWCDRILWLSAPGQELNQTNLGAAIPIGSSDHKPVWGSFDLKISRAPQGRTILQGDCTIVLKNMRATGLPPADVTGKSDPYLVFLGDFLKGRVRSEFKNQTLEPVWSDSDIPPIPLQFNSKMRLRHSTLLIQVWDYDVTSGDDFLCCATLPLSNFIVGLDDEKNDESDQPFVLELHRGGLPKGRLEGTISFKWQPSDFKPQILPLDRGAASI